MPWLDLVENFPAVDNLNSRSLCLGISPRFSAFSWLDPVAPASTFPLYTVSDGGYYNRLRTCHISLADYNDAWEGVRFIEKGGPFAVFLAWNATHFKRYFDGAGKERN